MEKETSKVIKSDHRLMELLTICNNSNQPNNKAREELHHLIQTTPAFQEVIKKQEGFYPVVLRTRIETMSSCDSFKEIMYVKCAQLREELGYSLANPLEKLAIEQIVLCWFNYYETELKHTSILSQSHNKDIGIYWEKRLAYASRRYERALETLAKMRKMNLVIQVNNATNQIISNK